MDRETYKKRAGTSGIQGQLYETKLISLIYFRLKYDDNVEQFCLATNRDDVGAFDDICFKAKIKGFEKPVTVFIQAKHRENDKLLTFTSKTDLAKYFDSYMEIRRAFEPSSKDMIFGGKFDETECFFVMYTTAKGDPNNRVYEGSFADNLKELIGTGGGCAQPSYTEEELDFLCKIVIKEQITSLAEQLASFICDDSESVMSMNNDLILRYHVILTHNVVHVSEIQSEGRRIVTFRQDFFTTNEEFIVLFKNILCLEVLKKRNSGDTNVQCLLLLKFLSEPSEVTTLSKLIGSVLTYKNSKLEFVDKSMTDDLKRQLEKVNVAQSTVYEAVELAAKDYLLSLKLKVPSFFGNKDLAVRGNPKKIEKRLNYLTLKIIEILEKSTINNIVAIDDSLGDGFLQLNGGIASAVGNILVFDESTKLLKFTDNWESLGNLAKTWYKTLESRIKNLHEYKFDVKVKKFPKLTFERGEYDVILVRDFYDKLLFYTNQADQNGVEEILRGEIEAHPCSDVNNFRVRSDVVFLKYHDEIQKLWMTPKVGSYLTKKNNIYESAVTNAMNEPLMGVLNIMHKIKKKGYTFNENALKSLECHGQIIGTVIATENCELTVAKVEQYLGNKDLVVLDLEFIFKLPLKNHKTLFKELTNTTKDNVFIIVCRYFQDPKNSSLENIAKAIGDKEKIIVTNKISVDIMTKYFSPTSNILNDKRIVFTDLSVESQMKFLATSKIKVQGKDVSLDIIGHDKSVRLIDEDVFSKLINNEIIEIGDTAIYNNHQEQFYIDRRISRTKFRKHDKFDDVKDKVVKTFYDLEDDVVLITGQMGMGKSTLLTHLSLKTKELKPEVWIVRLNLPEHERMFKILNANTVNTLIFFKFMCQAAFGEEYENRRKEGEVVIELEDSAKGTISRMKCSGGKSKVFQLQMFLHFYVTGRLIILIDGFDEIFWQYEAAVLSLLQFVRSNPRMKHKIWITSSSYNIIEQEFGPSYKLENFSRLEQETYLNTLWKIKIQHKNNWLQKILETDYFVDTLQLIMEYDRTQNDCLRGYELFLEFLKMEAAAAGIDFPYDHLKRSLGLCDTTISCFPEKTTPWHVSSLAEGCLAAIL